MKNSWFDLLEAAITICDREGIIVYMNQRSVETFEKDGGSTLLGQNLLDCHSPASAQQIRLMLKEHRENIYTIEKNGLKKIIIQKPVFDGNRFDGLIEMSFVLPADMPHFKRD
jgi:transcriptional regulator with PAS, ATPase and Fis domain